MWLAAYIGVPNWPWRASWFYPWQGSFDTNACPRHGYVFTFSVGHLVFQVLGCPSAEDLTVELGAESKRIVIQVWPFADTRAEWPPEFVLDEFGVEEFAGFYNWDHLRPKLTL